MILQVGTGYRGHVLTCIVLLRIKQMEQTGTAWFQQHTGAHKGSSIIPRLCCCYSCCSNRLFVYVTVATLNPRCFASQLMTRAL